MRSNNISSLWTILLLAAPVFGESLTPPPPPDIPPIVRESYPSDLDGDKIEDSLIAISADPGRGLNLGEGEDEPSSESVLVDVELVFKEQIAQQQIDDFLLLGGEITYIYRAVSYGWNGRIPLQEVALLPALMGPTLVLVEEPRKGGLDMDMATRTGRVRTIWKNLGFDGDSNITIGIIDTGADERHPDLYGDLYRRKVDWKDFSGDNELTPVDYNGHGSHVAGIAVGTGVAGGGVEHRQE